MAADERLILPFSRKKFALFVSGAVALTALFAFGAAVEPRQVWVWLGLAFFGPLTIWVVWRAARSGVLTGHPALVIDAEGLSDTQNRLYLRWEEIAWLERRDVPAWSFFLPALVVHPKDPEVVRHRLGRIEGSLTLAVARRFRAAPVTVSLQFVAASPDDVVRAIRRFWRPESSTPLGSGTSTSTRSDG
jgi:hypothetical protein